MSKYNKVNFQNRYASADQASTSELAWFLCYCLMDYFPNWAPESVLDELIAAGWTPGAILEAILGQAAEYADDAQATYQALVPMDECSMSISARSRDLEAAAQGLRGILQAVLPLLGGAEAAAIYVPGMRTTNHSLRDRGQIAGALIGALLGHALDDDEFTEASDWWLS